MDQLIAVHSARYVESIKKRTVSWVDPETPVYHNTYEIASLAAGAAIDALQTSLKTNSPTLALIRPPGHHAGVSSGGGFCYFNNVAIAAQQTGLKRLAIVDIDVHHGNGTSEIFFESDSALYVSTHQRGIYPGTGGAAEVGIHAGEGFNLNIPLSAGAGDTTFQLAMNSLILPVLNDYRPQAVIVSLGVDSHYLDPLASLTLSSSGYMKIVTEIIGISRTCALILEGGYDVRAVFDVVSGIISLANGAPYQPAYDEVKDNDETGKKDVLDALTIAKKYWSI